MVTSCEPYITFAVVVTVGNTGILPSASDVIVCISFDNWNVMFLADAIFSSIDASFLDSGIPPIVSISGSIYTDFLSMSTSNIVFPSESFTVNAPALIHFAFTPITFSIAAIIVPSTSQPEFQVFPPSVDIPQPAALNFTTIVASDNSGLSQK